MLPRLPIELSNLDKRIMKCGELFNKYFCKKSTIPNDRTEIANFHFSHYTCKSLETLRYHSNESSWKLTIKNIAHIEDNVISKYAKLQLHSPYGF